MTQHEQQAQNSDSFNRVNEVKKISAEFLNFCPSADDTYFFVLNRQIIKRVSYFCPHCVFTNLIHSETTSQIILNVQKVKRFLFPVRTIKKKRWKSSEFVMLNIHKVAITTHHDESRRRHLLQAQQQLHQIEDLVSSFVHHGPRTTTDAKDMSN